MKKRSLYEMLGVEKTSSPAEINKAFRRKAKGLHPDKRPGEKAAEAEMSELSNARAVLINDESRKRYDETGEAEAGPDITTSTATNMIAGLMNQLLMADPETPDFRIAIMGALQKSRAEIESKARPFRRAIGRAEKVKLRWSRKKKSQPNEMQRILDWQIEQQKTMISKIDADLRAIDRALEILNDYLYNADHGSQYGQATSTTSTVFIRF